MKKKLNVVLIFGGKSGEHEVSISSAVSVYQALDKNKYQVTLIGIDKKGRWSQPKEAKVLACSENPRLLNLQDEEKTFTLTPYESEYQMNSTESSGTSFAQRIASDAKIDVILPILHGSFGEDGTMQGLFELANIPYVGSGVLGSALGMDKDVSRRLLKAEGIPAVPSRVIRKSDFAKSSVEIVAEIVREFGLPFFVKPANMGSSVGVHKVKQELEAAEKIDDAFLFDNKVLIEKYIDARELECSVLGNEDPQVSVVGEIIPTHEFYSYEAKYLDAQGALLQIPAQNLRPETVEKIQEFSKKAFKALECRGMARVDFFVSKTTGDIYLNEINTIPGFTKISMYPKLWEASGKPFAKLLDELIELAIESHQQKNKIKTAYEY